MPAGSASAKRTGVAWGAGGRRSHDARLISRLCEDEEHSEIWIVDDGTVTKWGSDFDDFRESLIKEIREEQDAD